MKVYYKKHKKQQYEVIAVCDEDIIGKSIGNQKISEHFYKGQLIEIASAVEILRTATNFNIAGKSIVNACVDNGIITLQGIITFDNIPFALKILL